MQAESILTIIHRGLANSTLYFAAIAGVLGIISYVRRQAMSGSYWGVLAIGEILFLIQGILGAWLWLSGARPGRLGIHVLYGALTVITLPFYYGVSKGRDDRVASLMYGLICFLIAALSIRATVTGV